MYRGNSGNISIFHCDWGIYSLPTMDNEFDALQASCGSRFRDSRYVYFFPLGRISKICPFIDERRDRKEGYWNVRGDRNEYPFGSGCTRHRVPTTRPAAAPQFHGCNCDLLYRELAFKVSTLKVFYAWYHPLIEFKTDA